MNRYKEKQEARRERYEARADKARAEAASADKVGRSISDMIPMGQPILVGHYSEKRHRRDLARIDRAMQKQVDAYAKADHYEAKARSVGRAGISSDDPDAIAKLKAKREKCVASRELGKAQNRLMAAAVRKATKGGAPVDFAALMPTVEGLTEKTKANFLALADMYQGCRAPKYDLTNVGAEIRRLDTRIEQLEAEHKRNEEAPAEAIEGEGWTLEECAEDNRIRFVFAGKPDAETRKMLKANGFRWAPSVGAWQRHLHTGRYAAEVVARKLREWL